MPKIPVTIEFKKVYLTSPDLNLLKVTLFSVNPTQS